MNKNLPDINSQFAEWYQDVVYEAELADHSPVRGCMVIRPYGYALWENIRDVVDKKIKDTGHQNASFPLFIPKSFIEKEAQHVEGFAPELAVVTHAGGKELEEPLVVRPTSETIIHYMFAKWIKSYRDLPMKINQWANVVRWELRTRPFLRTGEFFWQEGHTAHETAQEAQDEAELMWKEYVDTYENYLAIPVIPGVKSESEKFAGADRTYTVEGLMPDGKALQMCTSHIISQNFAKAFGIAFQSREGKLEHPFLTSWGFTTRSIGALVMMHGDQKGLMMPPKVAPIQVVIVPIYKTAEQQLQVLNVANDIVKNNAAIRIHIDGDEQLTPGAKYYKWELRGVPLRIEIGPRDIANGVVMMVDRLGSAKEAVPVAELHKALSKRLELIHTMLFDRAKERMAKQWHKKAKLEEFGSDLAEHGGLYQTGWCRRAECEQKLKEYSATIRCVYSEHTFSECFACKESSPCDILIAKAY